MQRPTTSSGFEQQLEVYSATSKSIASASSWRDRLGSWPMYAAATASALACATSASAEIIYSGTLNLSTPILANYASNPGVRSASIALNTRVALNLVISSSVNVLAELDGQGLRFLDTAHDPAHAARLASGAPISSVPHLFNEDNVFLWLESPYHQHLGNWGPGNPATGFAAFRFNVGFGSIPSYDYGWLRLSVTANGDGDPDSITLIDYAYNNVAGQSIEAGQESAATPEPATKAMMLLAAGFAGVLAWRRRKAAV